MQLVQLFTRHGAIVDTVMISALAEVISWNGKYYSLNAGRYVEGDLLHASPTTACTQPDPVTATPVTATAGGIVGTQVLFR